MTIDRAPGPVDPRTVSMAGLSATAPHGWEVRARKWAESADGRPMPVFHAATVPLIPERGDYGSGVVEALGATDVFVSLVEFAPEDANTPLFAARDDLPRSVDPESFHPRRLQRLISGQAGQQVFFSYQDRAFCLYVVIGSAALRSQLASIVDELLAGLVVESTPTATDHTNPGPRRLRVE